MKVQSPSFRKLGVILFWVGLVIGVTLGGLGVWAAIEAVLFRSTVSADARLGTLSCPMMITPDEIGAVKATVYNPLDRSFDVAIRAYISEGYLTLSREEHMRVLLEPGERKQVQWMVSSDDMVWNRLILVKVYQFGGNSQPSRQGTCGIIVVGLPFVTGNLVVVFLFGVALILLLAGAYMWVVGNRDLLDRKPDAPRSTAILTVTVLGGMVCGVMGWWLPGLLIFMVIILVLVQSLGILTFSSR